MAQNKLKIILCHTVILCLMLHKVSAANETKNESEHSRTLETLIDQNASVIDDQNALSKSACTTTLEIVKLIYKYYYPAALVIVSLVFGISLEFQKIGDVLKRPFAPIISVFCNYIFSPLVSAWQFLRIN